MIMNMKLFLFKFKTNSIQTMLIIELAFLVMLVRFVKEC